ncbi:hypothetical protein [Kiloniella laminariae]|nr:hypothetical protein [Kiloniella laminariae]
MVIFISWIAFSDSSYQISLANTPAPHGAEESSGEIGLIVPVKYQQQQLISGKTVSIDLSKNVEKQLDTLWIDFLTDDLAHSQITETPNSLYLVYHDYDTNQETVLVTLGYRINSDNSTSAFLDSFIIPAGDYIQQSGANVLEAWSSPQNNEFNFTYAADYELYQFGAGDTVVSQTTFLGVITPMSKTNKAGK